MGFFDKLLKTFTRPKPKADKTVPFRPSKSLAEKLKRQRLEGDPLYQFLTEEQWVNVSSSNVSAIRYVPGEKELQVEFHDGSRYRYWPISEDEAADLFKAPSKGGWVWDELRVRGTACGHQKNYAPMSPQPPQRVHCFEKAFKTAKDLEAKGLGHHANKYLESSLEKFKRK